MTLVYISIAWILGILLGSKVHLPVTLLAASFAPIPLLIFRRTNRRAVILTTVCLLAFLGAALYYTLRLPATDHSAISFYRGENTATLKGLVSSPPEIMDKSTRFRFTAQEMKIDNRWQIISGTALVYVPAYSEYRYGDLLLLSGRLETPPQFDGFDYREYLAHQGISTIVYYPELEVIAKDQSSKIPGWIYALRSNLGQAIARTIPEPQASLTQGIVLGLRGNIPDELNRNFSLTGTAHILAISGANLSIIAGIFLSLGLWLFGRRRYFYVWCALFGVWLYVLVTGMQAPVVRGANMASIFLVSELLGRQRSALTALAFAAAVMVAVNPEVLWTISFQMSFLAMAGLILISPKLQALGRGIIKARLGETGRIVPAANFLSDSLSVSTSAIAVTWPLTAYYFNTISFTGLLANLFALPSLPVIVITGGITGILGLITPVLAQIVGWTAWLFTSYMTLVVNAFAAMPGAAIQAGGGNAILVWSYYPLLAATLLASKRDLTVKIANLANIFKTNVSDISVNAKIAKWVVPPLLVAALLLSLAVVNMPDDKLHVNVLDVGQGDAILVQTPAHQDILIDGGPDSRSVMRELGKIMPFGDRTIDLVILTHPHADHFTGLIEVLKRYKVKQVLFPDLADDSPAYQTWLALISEKGIESTFATEGQQIELGNGTKLIVWNPPARPTGDMIPSVDDSGIVLELMMGKASFLFTSDISQQAETALAARRALPAATVLKVAHHGSDTATSAAFLAVSRPQVAAISVGADNRFGHPKPEVLGGLEISVGYENIWRTDQSGTIEFITDGERLWVDMAKSSP